MSASFFFSPVCFKSARSNAERVFGEGLRDGKKRTRIGTGGKDPAGARKQPKKTKKENLVRFCVGLSFFFLFCVHGVIGPDAATRSSRIQKRQEKSRGPIGFRVRSAIVQ